MLQIKLDMFQTLAFTVLLIWLGDYLRKKFPIYKLNWICSKHLRSLFYLFG